MWGLVGNPEDRFSHNEAHILRDRFGSELIGKHEDMFFVDVGQIIVEMGQIIVDVGQIIEEYLRMSHITGKPVFDVLSYKFLEMFGYI